MVQIDQVQYLTQNTKAVVESILRLATNRIPIFANCCNTSSLAYKADPVEISKDMSDRCCIPSTGPKGSCSKAVDIIGFSAYYNNG